MTTTASNTALHAIPTRNRLPLLALRRRSADHPMAMFAIVTGVCLLTMSFAPNSGGPAFATFGAPAKISHDIKAGAKVPELPVGATDIACRGQTWGDEDEACLVQIAQDSGKGDRVKVRKLASAAPFSNAPNIF